MDNNPDRLDDGARAEAEMKEREAKRHPLEAYADSYAQMGRDPQGDGRVDCRSVEVDIRQNMIPVTTALPAPQGDDTLVERLLAAQLGLSMTTRQKPPPSSAPKQPR